MADTDTKLAAEKHAVVVDEHSVGLRLDQFLAANVPGLSRRKARLAIDIGGVFIDKKRIKVAGRKVRRGQRVEVHLGGALARATPKLGRLARSSDAARVPQVDILFEDEHLIVLFKPSGLLTAPTPESDRNNLADQLRQRAGGAAVFIVHRLDMETSGVLIVAKTTEANKTLGEMFRKHDLVRRYTAFVDGVWPRAIQCIEDEVGGKTARSDITMEKQLGTQATQLTVTLHTGRTHQIRIHMSNAGFPVLGDRLYGQPSALGAPRLALHAHHIGFAHPVTGEVMAFDSPLPPDLATWIETL